VIVMADEIFDVIIVGGGIAGTVAAYLLAREGMEAININISILFL
jgi:electron transfer flavoprotein-quinone oxidoreductase